MGLSSIRSVVKVNPLVKKNCIVFLWRTLAPPALNKVPPPLHIMMLTFTFLTSRATSSGVAGDFEDPGKSCGEKSTTKPSQAPFLGDSHDILSVDWVEEAGTMTALSSRTTQVTSTEWGGSGSGNTNVIFYCNARANHFPETYFFLKMAYAKSKGRIRWHVFIICGYAVPNKTNCVHTSYKK